MTKQAATFLFHRHEFVFRPEVGSIATFTAQGIYIHFTRAKRQLISMEKSPFGGFDLAAGDDDRRGAIRYLLIDIDQYALEHNIARVEIRCHPDIYDVEGAALVSEELVRAGYRELYHDIAQSVVVEKSSPDLNTHRRRRLRKCIEAGFIFKQLSVVNDLPAAYQLIEESRKSKGYPVTMTLPALLKMHKLFPHDYLLFGVHDHDQLIACCLAIRVLPSILYCFYIGDSLSYRKFSPVTLLITGVYEYCLEHHVELMDLGISTNRGIINKGLYAFKKSLGAQSVMKRTFEKVME